MDVETGKHHEGCLPARWESDRFAVRSAKPRVQNLKAALIPYVTGIPVYRTKVS